MTHCVVNFRASDAILLSADLLRPQTKLTGNLGRASVVIFKNKTSLMYINNWFEMPLY